MTSCSYMQLCVKKELCAEATVGMVIRSIFAWFSPWMHVRLWIWKHFVCWCAYHFYHMLKVHVRIRVNVQFPARGWHICMRVCKCVCLCATEWGGVGGWGGQGLMRSLLCVFACGKRWINMLVNQMLNEGVDEVAGKCVSASICVYMYELLS